MADEPRADGGWFESVLETTSRNLHSLSLSLSLSLLLCICVCVCAQESVEALNTILSTKTPSNPAVTRNLIGFGGFASLRWRREGRRRKKKTSTTS